MQFNQVNHNKRDVNNTLTENNGLPPTSPWWLRLSKWAFFTIVIGLPIGIFGNWLANYYQDNFDTTWKQIVNPAWIQNRDQPKQ